MKKQNSTRLFNEFGSIDYRKPSNKQQDMRTSSYLGHKLIDDTMLGNKSQIKFKETKLYEEDRLLEQSKTSDYKANYVWKNGDPNEIRNVSLNRRINFMKPFSDCRLKFLKRPMRPANSVTHSDFLWQPEIPFSPPEQTHFPAPVKSTKILIDRNKPGYSKYLDPGATTTRLDYCYRSPKDVLNGIAAKDNITFWNWKDIEYHNKNVFQVKDLQMCDKLPSNECTKRRCEFTSTVKAVPNSGLTTEVRENFINPNERSLVVDDRHPSNNINFMD